MDVLSAQDKVHIFNLKMHISTPNSMFDHLLESSHLDNSNKWSNIGFSKEITQVVPTLLILCILSAALSTDLPQPSPLRIQ